MALNRGCAYRSQIGPGEAGRTLLEYLITSYPHSDEATWQARIADGDVRLDDAPAAGSERLRPGQICEWHRAPWDEPDVPLGFDVVYEDAALLVVNKPAGLPTMPAGGFLEHTLWSLVRARDAAASPVHRLGRFTSGLVVFARTPEAASVLSRDWRDRCVDKQYRALGQGHPSWDHLVIDVPIGAVPHPRLGRVYAASPTGKPARSIAEVLARRGPDTLFDIRIVTGRPHQIRIHLAAAGHPLAGDPLYAVGGVPRGDAPGLPGDGGYWLHAHRLTIAHPSTRAPMHFEAPLPAPLT